MTDEFEYVSADIAESVHDDSCYDRPPECKVRFYNDDYTTMEFVVDVLKSVFHKAEQESVSLMTLIHEKGSAVVGTYSYDVAVTRVSITTELARKAGFPLRCEVEE